MEVKTDGSARLRLKDIITLSIFNIAMLVIMVIVKMVMTIAATPALDYLFYVGVMAFFCAPLYIVMSNKTAKHGTFLVTAIFCGLMMAAFGSAWFSAVMLVVGLICELLMLGNTTYKNPVRNGIGYVVYWTLYAWGSSIPLFFFKDSYLKSLGDSYTEEGKQVLIRFYGSLDMLLLIGLISAALAAAGFWVGMLFFKKHIQKSKVSVKPVQNLDPRTHLAVMLCATAVWFFYEQIGQMHCLCLLAGCYLLQVKEVRTAGRLCLFYTILQVLARICAPHTALLYVILHTLARSIPLVMFAAAIVKSNPSRLMASWQSLHIPKSVTIMLCMMMRFFPVLRKEMASIREGIKARGLFPHWHDYIRHPVIVYESFFVPFTVRCLKLSAELGATAELRGLDAPQKRSSIYATPLSVYDYLTVGLYGTAMVLIAIV